MLKIFKIYIVSKNTDLCVGANNRKIAQLCEENDKIIDKILVDYIKNNKIDKSAIYVDGKKLVVAYADNIFSLTAFNNNGTICNSDHIEKFKTVDEFIFVLGEIKKIFAYFLKPSTKIELFHPKNFSQKYCFDFQFGQNEGTDEVIASYNINFCKKK